MSSESTDTTNSAGLSSKDELSAWVSHYLCLLFSLALITARLILRRKRRQVFTSGDYWCITTGFFILVRLVAHHFVLLYGSTRVARGEIINLPVAEYRATTERMVLGSKLVLLTRTILICILWSAKMAVLDLLSSLIMRLPFEKPLLYIYRAVLALTFVASVVTVFTSCIPLSLAWQIDIQPFEWDQTSAIIKCTIAAMWIYTYEASNMLTDVMLMALSFGIIHNVRIPAWQKARISLLFSIGIVLVIFSIVRIFRGQESTTEAGHTAYESVEVLFGTIVAVTPTLYTLMETKEPKKQSASGSVIRVPSPAGPGHELNDLPVQEDDASTARIYVQAWNQDWWNQSWGPVKSAPKM